MLNLYQNAVTEYGLSPGKTRTDMGVENYYLRDLLGDNALVGSSVHNQRVERLNRDINNNIHKT